MQAWRKCEGQEATDGEKREREREILSLFAQLLQLLEELDVGR